MRINYDFLNEINKPNFQPPDWVFNLVWPALYTIMFISFYIFLNTKTTTPKWDGIIIFILQLILNFAWLPAFFTFKNVRLSMVILVLLTICVFYMITTFYKTSPISGLMNIPYLVWVIFADALNWSICIKN